MKKQSLSAELRSKVGEVWGIELQNHLNVVRSRLRNAADDGELEMLYDMESELVPYLVEEMASEGVAATVKQALYGNKTRLHFDITRDMIEEREAEVAREKAAAEQAAREALARQVAAQVALKADAERQKREAAEAEAQAKLRADGMCLLVGGPIILALCGGLVWGAVVLFGMVCAFVSGWFAG